MTTQQINDSYKNVVANLGTDRDKASHGVYAFNLHSPEQLLVAYKSSWLAQAIVDVPPEDTVRKWRAWQATPDQITDIEAEEKRLNLRKVLMMTDKASRLFGGAVIYISTGDANPDQPLRAERVGRGGIKALIRLTPQMISPGAVNRDIENAYYGRPEFYTISTGEKTVKVHASRLVVLHGVPVLDEQTSVSNGWGDSSLEATLTAALQADSASANIASLIFEAKVDVFKFKGMAASLTKQNGVEALTQRLTSQAVMKGINGAVVIDAEDDYNQKSASFAGLDAVWDRFMLNVSGASRIPVTRLYGRSAAGLSGGGDGDERVYYDRIGSRQTLEIEPAMAILDECLIRSALGARPADVWYKWNPLRQITEKERAEIFKTTADAARAVAGAQVGELIPVDVLSQSLVNEFIEQGVLPGLEQAIEEFGSLAEQDIPPDDDTPLPPEPASVVVAAADAATPRTLYVRRDVLNKKDIIRWALAAGFTDVLPNLHVTIAYSRQPVDWFNVGTSWSDRLEIAAGGPRQMESLGPDGKYKALLIMANELVWRNKEIREMGASWEWPDYQPHISIQINGDIDLKTIEPYRGRIVLGPEIFEEIKEDR